MNMERNEIENDILRITKENGMYCEWGVDPDGTVMIEIDWGDWKHDHLYTDYIMKQNGYRLTDECVTDEDGSDTYSSIHYYKRTEG